MVWYIAVFAFCLFSWGVYSYTKSERSKIFLEITILFVLILFSGTRYRIGGYDYEVYEEYYNDVTPPIYFILNDFKGYGSDSLYFLYNSIIKAIGFNFYGFTLVESIFFHILLYRGIKKNKIDFNFFIIAFLYKLYIFNTFVSMRQSLVLVIFFNAIPLIKDKKRIKYIITMLICALIHTSAIVLIIFAFVDKVVFSKKSLVVYSSVFFVFFSLNILGAYIFNPSGILTRLFLNNNSIMWRVTQYFNDARPVNIMSTIETYLIVVLIIMMYDRLEYEDEEKRIFINIFLFTVPLVTLFRSFEIVTRIRDYCAIAFPFVLFYIASKQEGENKAAMYFCVIVLCFLGYYRYINNYGGLVPYDSYLFKNISIIFNR